MEQEDTQPKRGRDFDGIVRRSIDVECRVLDEESRSVEVIASSEDLDSHGDKIKQHWNLERFLGNPTVLWNHNRFEAGMFGGGTVDPVHLMPIGRAENVKVKGKKLQATLVLGSAEYSEIAQKVYLGLKEKIIRAVSVGFYPGFINPIKDKAGNVKHFEIGSEDMPNELLEISFVPIGSNPAAVAKSIAFEREHLGRMAAGNQEAGEPGQENDAMAMTAEEKAELEAARTKAATAEARVTTVEAVLTETKTALATQKARADALETTLGKSMLDGFQTKKFGAPARERFEKLLGTIGLEETRALLESLPDLSVTVKEPVKAGDTETKGTDEVDVKDVKSVEDDTSSIHKELLAAANA